MDELHERFLLFFFFYGFYIDIYVILLSLKENRHINSRVIILLPNKEHTGNS